MNLKEQLIVFDEFADISMEMLHLMLERPGYRETIKAKARARFLEGYRLYGDRMFNVPLDELFSEIIEEVSDGVAYSSALWFRHYREGGE